MSLLCTWGHGKQVWDGRVGIVLLRDGGIVSESHTFPNGCDSLAQKTASFSFVFGNVGNPPDRTKSEGRLLLFTWKVKGGKKGSSNVSSPIGYLPASPWFTPHSPGCLPISPTTAGAGTRPVIPTEPASLDTDF